MNIFEDLIEELKEENLLEETVIETNNFANQNLKNQPPNTDLANSTSQAETIQKQAEIKEISQPTQFGDEDFSFQTFFDSQDKAPDQKAPDQSEDFQTVESPATDPIEEPFQAVAFQKATPEIETAKNNEIDDQLIQNLFQQNDLLTESIFQVEEQLLANEELVNVNPIEVEMITDFGIEINTVNPLLSKTIPNDHEFFRRRATEEVNSLQIVEHIISAIEREQMKIMPKPYDDLPVSMALHDFLKITETPNSPEHAQAEFKLMQETESWYSALSQRDKHISVGDLRKYCENTKPALSSQALISLARFYRNSPFSEAVRGKFDMVITKLLTKEKLGDTRELIFTREELFTQIGNLYADWSSIPLYETSEDDSDVLIGVLKFEDFANEANSAQTFEELIKNDFFNRLKIYKESTGEKFFAPLLTATAIESNVVIGNKYVELIKLERERNNEKILKEKYSFLLDQSVSDATSKTLQLVEILEEKNEPAKPVVVETVPEIKETLNLENNKKEQTSEKGSGFVKRARKVNKLLVAFVVLAFMFLGGVYFWAEYFAPQMKTSIGVKKVNLDNSSLKEYFKTARISKNTFYAVTEPAWNKLSKDVKEDVLKKTLAVGSEKGYNKIHVLDAEGKTIAFASDQGITLDPK